MKSYDEIINQVNSLSLEELKINAATYLKIIDHFNFHSNSISNESRRREQLRMQIAKRKISSWHSDFTIEKQKFNNELR